MNLVILLVVVLCLVVTYASFHVLVSVLLVINLLEIIVAIVSVQTNVVNHVPPVWKIASGSVNITSVPKDVVRCVIALAVMAHALNT